MSKTRGSGEAREDEARDAIVTYALLASVYDHNKKDDED